MGSRTLINVVTPNSIALNAQIYGYAGHSLQTPHVPLQQLWWTDERIQAKVTKDFVLSRLRPDERARVEDPLAFGGGLTDYTYLEWILEKAKRFFLILEEIGAPDQIFGIIDDSWDDEDLPLPLEMIERLALSYNHNGQLNRKFYQTQFTFLLRELAPGLHLDYGRNEVVPLEILYKLPPAASLQNWLRVHLPKKADTLFVRRKFTISDDESKPNAVPRQQFIDDVESAQFIEHDHIAPIWASFTSKNAAYTMTSFVGHHTLKSFIDHRTPAQYQKLGPYERQTLPLTWLHCLSEAVTALHQMGYCHTAIRPSQILIDEDNNIAFCDIGSLATFQKDKKPDPLESYNYAPPEAHASILQLLMEAEFKTTDDLYRARSISSKSSSSRSRSSNSISSPTLQLGSPTKTAAALEFNFHKKATAEPTMPSAAATEQADIFSLGCVFLDILSFLLKKKPHDFTRHRSSKQKNVGSRGGSTRIDSSFHANPDRLHSWMLLLEASTAKCNSEIAEGIPALLTLVRSMLSPYPEARPTAAEVSSRVHEILVSYSRIPDLHCSARHIDTNIGIAISHGPDIQGLEHTATSPTSHSSNGSRLTHDEDDYDSKLDQSLPTLCVPTTTTTSTISRPLSAHSDLVRFRAQGKPSLMSRWMRPLVRLP